ncbi:MAG: HlyD family secretion protein [Novosphingobium sp.]
MAEGDPQIVVESAAPLGPEPSPELPATPTRAQRLRRLALMALVPLAVIAGGLWYWLGQQGNVTTDNAYVKQDKVSVGAQVGGRIVAVLVREDQAVRAGDLLFRIDPEPFQLQIAQADAAIATAQAGQIALAGSSALSGADIAAAREDIGYAQSRLERQRALWSRGFTTKADYEAAQHQVAEAREELRLAEAKSGEARAKLASGSQVPGVYPQVAAARAQRAAAELNLRRTEVRAPMAGRVSQADRLQVGQEVVSGLPVVTLVGDATSYVEANFKETDLAEMAVGQRAELRFDAYPGLVLKGHVASIGAGTGSEFSVLPAQNATGNWVKVTQRVPVRIALDQASPRRLIAGLSTKVKVFTDGAER